MPPLRTGVFAGTLDRRQDAAPTDGGICGDVGQAAGCRPYDGVNTAVTFVIMFFSGESDVRAGYLPSPSYVNSTFA